jgi:hypothetical protein
VILDYHFSFLFVQTLDEIDDGSVSSTVFKEKPQPTSWGLF